MAFIDTNTIPVQTPLPGWDGRFFNSQHMTFGYYRVKAGSTIHEHHHANEETWHVIEGELEVTIGNETRIAGPGCVALVPPNTPHSVRALTDGHAIVVDHPRRTAIRGETLAAV